MSCVIVFICHDNSSIEHVLSHGHYIIFVGDKEIKDEYRNNPNIIIAKELVNNIETEWKLLTFTAWYAIIKNNLFIEYEYICILEYDVILNDFENQLYKTCKKSHDLISFIASEKKFLKIDINYEVCINYLIKNGFSEYDYNILNVWASSTNHCIKRPILEDFVNWYYPSCLFIKDHDPKKLGYYHERIFAIYCFNKKYDHCYISNILRHLQLVSHKT